MSGSGLMSFFLVTRDTATRKLMLGTSSIYGGLFRKSTHWYTLWIWHTSTGDLTQYAFPYHYKWITTFMDFIPIYAKSSSTDTPTVVITATNISGYQDPCMFPVLPWFVVMPINFTGGIFTTGTGLSASMLYFVNRTTGRWSVPYVANYDCDSKDTFLMHYPHHCLSTIMWLCCIATSYRTITSSFLDGVILQISTATIRIAACVPCGVHYPLVQRFFAVHCNQISEWTLPPTSTV